MTPTTPILTLKLSMEAKIIVTQSRVNTTMAWTMEMTLIVKRVRMINLTASSQMRTNNHLNKKLIKNSQKKSWYTQSNKHLLINI